MIQMTLLTKKANFKGITRVNLAAQVIAVIVAIVMALNGYGVWSLVVQNLLIALFRTLFLWSYSRWTPLKQFSLKLLHSFTRLSYKLVTTSLINAVFNNIYPSIIAYFYPNAMHQVGYYNQAQKYQDIPFGILSNTFRSVSILILPEINDQTERLHRVVSKMMKSLAFLSFPIGFLMILIAEPTFLFLFQEKWLPAVPYFRILTLAGIISPFAFILNELFIAREKANYFLGVEIIRRLILVLLIALLFRYGIMGLAASWVIYTYVTLIISLILSRRLIRYSLSAFASDVLPYLLLALISSGIAWFITRNIQHDLLFIFTGSVIVVFFYLLFCRLLRLEMIQEIKEWFITQK